MEPQIIKKTLELEILDNCTLSCNTCARLQFPRTKQILSINEILDIIKGYDRIQFMGTRSEPTLYPGFIDLIEKLLEAGYEVEIYTNGISKSTWWVQFNNVLEKYKNKVLIFWALAGTNEDDHKVYRQSSLDKLLSNVIIMSNSLNIGLFILFDYNTKKYSNPIKPIELLELQIPLKDKFIGILFIHSGDYEIDGPLKAQDIGKYFINTNTPKCIGNTTNFYSIEGALFKCKYQYEDLSPTERKLLIKSNKLLPINIKVCNSECNFIMANRIKDNFVTDKILFTREFNEIRVFNNDYIVNLKNKD